ncbi:probable pyridoxal 5'-phosphate synthase subunit pdx2 isoform X2 [Lingula anatina]|uniref:glutaminase n=1 Tax=Lingula anatina TaxID=7574 RepID=A0A1S3KFV0_LINAN|nr:probable pyridoxal 5'-phosphate synthase subunit pdx2 isoform X2 [Lingula anatina]|eukprot:XP_013421106.1 probable pyridoxal 5'-phosphate synthase subunit pdx2 isoform X2 [Lingula anatina]
MRNMYRVFIGTLLAAMSNSGKLRIGILGIQGAFQEHKVALLKAHEAAKCDDLSNWTLDIVDVRSRGDVTDDLDGLILPGGESTTMSLFLKREGLDTVLREWMAKRRRVTWGTCAGMILLAENIEHQKEGGQSQLGGLHVTVSRNYFGRQVDSFEADVTVSSNTLTGSCEDDETCRGVFIRAPAVISVDDPRVKVIGSLTFTDRQQSVRSVIVAVQEENILATAFHPELTDDTRWHRHFLEMVKQNKTSI